MATTTRVGLACLAALALACRGGADGPAPTEPTGTPTTTTDVTTVNEPGICDPQPVFERNLCLACHGEVAQGGLDLRPAGLAERLVDVPSTAQGCDGRLLINPVSPENSQLLRVLAPDESGSCILVMPPPPSTIPDADIACIEEWVESFAEDKPLLDFEPTPIQAAVTRVKRLTTGTTPTAEELARIEADPSVLPDVVREWTHTERFETATNEILRRLLQVNERLSNWLQIDGKNMAGIPSGRFRTMHVQSVLRTAWDLIDRDRPFTEIFHTNRWAMSTSMLVMMRYTDQTPDEMAALDGTHQLIPAPAKDPFDWTDGPSTTDWPVPGLQSKCRPDMTLTARQLLHLQWGQVDCKGMPDYRFELDAPLVPVVDDEDWRFIDFELVPADGPVDAPVFYDLDAWRAVTGTVQTRIPRSGFMTTPAFLNNWETNPDNQFRVTTNQMLIVALGSTFSLGEPTEPPSRQGLDAGHSDPTTDCYGCHRQLDPMRGYFSAQLSDTWRLPPTEFDLYDPDVLLPFTPSFAFGGQTATGGDLEALGEILADHPGVATAWTQKLCWIANGVPCNIDDPEFQRVATAFADRGHSYRELVVELFSSPLVTGLEPTLTHPEQVTVGPQRSDQWCASVGVREVESCATPEVREPLGLLPTIGFVRGKVDPVVPQRLTVFSIAGLEKSCQSLAAIEVGDAGAPFPRDTRATTLQSMVEVLAGLAPGHDRHQPLLDALDAHVTEVLDQTGELQTAMESAYVLACTTPDAAALGL